MSRFSKINCVLLAIAVAFTTLSQVQISSGQAPIFPDAQESGIPAYSGITSHLLWGFIDFDSSSSLFNLYSTTDSEEDSKDNIDAESARESSLERLSALYLFIARDIDGNPTIGELLYPFHFYF